MSDERSDRGLGGLVSTIGLALLVAAVVRELRTPPDERQWHGRIVGVPYDLRPPSFAREKAAWWSPDDPRIFTPRGFGVGWALNLGRIRRLVAG